MHNSLPLHRKKPFGFSPNIFFLSIVSFLTDVSSEMIFTLLPLFLFNVLQVGTPVIGLIEGIAESTAALFKILSGWLSDKLGKRKMLATLGYGISTLAKPFLYFIGSWGPILVIRFIDRMGKGIRTAPRDALIADSSSPQDMGKNFGFHRAMDTLGAVAGLGIAAIIVFLLQEGGLEITRSTFQVLVLAGTVPAVIAVGIILVFVHDSWRMASDNTGITPAINPTAEHRLDKRFRRYMAIMILFTLGNSSDAFLILRAQDLGLSIFHILLVFVFFNLVYALASFPAGKLSDTLGRRKVIILGWSTYALSYLGFALASEWWHVWLVFGLYGAYYGATEGVARAFVADMVATESRGTAYGVFHTVIGITTLPASILAGWLWHWINPSAPLFLGAVLAGIAALSLATLIRE